VDLVRRVDVHRNDYDQDPDLDAQPRSPSVHPEVLPAQASGDESNLSCFFPAPEWTFATSFARLFPSALCSHVRCWRGVRLQVPLDKFDRLSCAWTTRDLALL